MRRLRDSTDRRRVRVELTELAQQLADELYAPMGADGWALLAGYEPGELRLLCNFLRGSRELQERHEARIRASAPAAQQDRAARRPADDS